MILSREDALLHILKYDHAETIAEAEAILHKVEELQKPYMVERSATEYCELAHKMKEILNGLS